jgi:hypothetical protein
MMPNRLQEGFFAEVLGAGLLKLQLQKPFFVKKIAGLRENINVFPEPAFPIRLCFYVFVSCKPISSLITFSLEDSGRSGRER